MVAVVVTSTLLPAIFSSTCLGVLTVTLRPARGSGEAGLTDNQAAPSPLTGAAARTVLSVEAVVSMVSGVPSTLRVTGLLYLTSTTVPSETVASRAGLTTSLAPRVTPRAASTSDTVSAKAPTCWVCPSMLSSTSLYRPVAVAVPPVSRAAASAVAVIALFKTESPEGLGGFPEKSLPHSERSVKFSQDFDPRGTRFVPLNQRMSAARAFARRDATSVQLTTFHQAVT